MIEPALLWDALRAKQAFAQTTGTNVPVVTPFGFRPQAVFDWQRECVKRGIALPVHAGLAGPTPLPRLIRFAMQCGIGTSLRALARNAGPASDLLHAVNAPDEVLIGLVQGAVA